jgi:GTPase SAR1 family protein
MINAFMTAVKTAMYDEAMEAITNREKRKNLLSQTSSVLKEYPRRSFLTAIIISTPLILKQLGFTGISSGEVAGVLGFSGFVTCVVLLWLIPSVLVPNENTKNTQLLGSDILTLCIFGLGGSGKTTFIEKAFREGNHSLNSDKMPDPGETQRFCLHEFSSSELRNSEMAGNFKIRIADYSGQHPDQLLNPGVESNDELRRFICREGEEVVINAIIFVVDIVGRPEDYNVIDDSALKVLLNSNLNDAFMCIQDRIEDHKEYINRGMVQSVFTVMKSKNLNLVKLLVNKKDILESMKNNELDKRKSQVRIEEIEAYVKDEFQKRLEVIAELCKNISGEREVKPELQFVSFSDLNDIYRIKSEIYSKVPHTKKS